MWLDYKLGVVQKDLWNKWIFNHRLRLLKTSLKKEKEIGHLFRVLFGCFNLCEYQVPLLQNCSDQQLLWLVLVLIHLILMIKHGILQAFPSPFFSE